MTMLTQLAQVARRTGYPVVEVPGWQTRGRPGGMSDIRTITTHHTANGGAPGNFPSLRVVRDGRPGLNGPLAQYGLGIDGTIYVIAAGLCNHAGVSKSVDYINPHAVGIEAEAIGVPGTKGDWPAKQMDSYARLCRALADEFAGAQLDDVRGHKETCAPTGRKSDPDFDMPAFRRQVAVVDLSHPSPLLEEEDFMDPTTLKAVATAVAATPIRNKQADGSDGAESTIGGSITAVEYRTELIIAEQTAQRALLEELLQRLPAPESA